MRLLMILGLASIAVAACGGDDSVAPTATATAGASGTSLTITVDPGASGDVREYTLVCDPPGGDHPDPDAACAALAQTAGGETSPLDPVPTGVSCTEIYGGDQTALIEGTLDGVPVRTELSRVNGCEIERWDALAPVVVELGGVEGL